ncbi:MAG: threonylcarbamoyl-AMP synthase [Treponema sp.]|jgi:L-threonylcarbamoyladenylate synthase|nr:threonylcarbamoyl-AMP synthase [Treponema sp.]
MEFLPVSQGSLLRAAEVLRRGGLAVFPTETVYGLGADAYNAAAVAKVFEAKGRPRFDPLIIHIAAAETLEHAADLSMLTEETKQKLSLLAKEFWPGPLSIVLPKSEKIPGIATAGLSTAAFRIPDHDAALKLISLSGGAVAAPSANPFGALSPTRAEYVRDTLSEKVDIILDGGSTKIGVESTVLDIMSDSVKILRPGGTPKEAIEKLIGPVEDNAPSIESAPSTEGGFISPGQLKSHYAPKTPLKVFSREEIINLSYKKGIAFLFFDSCARDEWLKAQTADTPIKEVAIRVLSKSGNTTEAAACFFETLHELDKCNTVNSRNLENGLEILCIYAQFAPQEGLGAAINDRLRRAGA